MRTLLGSLLALLLLAACGSGSHGSVVSAASYMESICGALGPWETDLRARSTALQPPRTASATQRKRLVQEFLSSVIADTDTALNRLRRAHSPDVSGGRKLAGDLVAAFTQLKATYVRASQQARSLPTTSVAALQNAILSLASTVDSSLANIGTRLGALETPALRQAEAKAPACSKLSR